MTQETPLTLWLTLRNIKLRRNNTSCHSNGESQFQWIKDWILFWNNLYLSSTGEQNCQTFSIPVVYKMNEWTCSYNDTVIIIKHTSLDFTSFWTSAWLCTGCQQVNCQLCFWQNCDSSGRQSALQSDALRLNAPSTSFLVQITTLNSRNGPLLLFPVLNWYWTRAVAHLTHSRWTLIEQWRAI